MNGYADAHRRAGPVGLTLAIDLGKRGIRCTLIEKTTRRSLSEMGALQPTDDGIFPPPGISETVRAAGYPQELARWTLILLFDLIVRAVNKAHPTVAEAKARRDATMDGSLPLEPYQIISQYTLEPLLKSVVEKIPNVAVKFGHEFVSFTEQAGGVTAQFKKTNGEEIAIRAEYVVGCDGGSRRGPQAARVQNGGRAEHLEMRQALFHCPELYDKVRAPRARHYHRIDDHWTLMIVQDSARAFHHSCRRRQGQDMKTQFEKLVGTP